MTTDQRIAIARIIVDIIKADRVIEVDEMQNFNNLIDRYNISPSELKEAYTISFADAVGEITLMPYDEQLKILNDLCGLANSNGSCTRDEALILLALKYCLSDMGADADVISVKVEERWFDDCQLLYLEPSYDNDVNSVIERDYRILSTELRLAGFDFVYIPRIVSQYVSTDDKFMRAVVLMLDPSLSERALNSLITRVKEFTTAGFCIDQLGWKLGFAKLREMDTTPSVIFRIGISRIGKDTKANFLRIFVDKKITDTLRKLTDDLRDLMTITDIRIPNVREEKGEFAYSGFYRQFFDILLMEPVVKNKLIVNLIEDREPLRFYPSGFEVSDITRRDKALYTLLVHSIPNGGIKFPTPQQINTSAKAKEKMDSIQSRYRKFYQAFGGDPALAPDLSDPKRRNPMLAKLRREMGKLRGSVENIDKFIIERNNAGYYMVAAAIDDFLCLEVSDTNLHPIHTSRLFKENPL